MSDLVHNFATRKRNRGASFKWAVDAMPKVSKGEGPNLLEIVISGSPKMGSNDQSNLENATMIESGEASPPPTTIQVIHPSKQAPSRPERPLRIRTERIRPSLPDQLLLNSYHPPWGRAPLMEEVSSSGPKGA